MPGEDVVEVRLLERVRDVPESAWNAVLGDDESPFVEWTWLDCLEEAGCVDVVGIDQRRAKVRTGWIPRHLAIERGGRLVAVAPTYVKLNSEGEFVYDWSWADVAARVGVDYYPKLVVAVPFTPATGPRLIVRPGEERAPLVGAAAVALRRLGESVGASGSHVLFPREDEAELWEGAGLLRRSSFQYHWFRQGARTFEEYVARFDSKRRNQIRRESSRAAKDGIRIETVRPEAIDPPLVHAMYRFYTSTVDKFHWGRRYLNPRFFELVAERFRHRLAWVVASDQGTPIAGAFNVQKGSRLYGRYWGATVERPFLHFDVCYYHGIRHCLEHGLDVFEPGAGGEHKRARGFVPTETCSAHDVWNPKLRAILEPHLLRERVRVAEIVRGEREDDD